MLKLNIQQINNLIQGTGLATEIPATSQDRRAFIKVEAAQTTGFLNTTDVDSLRFWLRKYELGKEFIDHDWDVSDEELDESVHIVGIIGLEQLQSTLAKYLNDFSTLNVEWKCDNPL